MVLSIVYSNWILGCFISALVGALAVFLFFRYKNPAARSAKSLDDMKPGPKKDIILGIRDNAYDFADLFEPLFLLSDGNTSRKEAVFDAWNSKVASSYGTLEFKSAFATEFGYVEKWKGKKSKYVKNAKKLVKYIRKAGISRNGEVAVEGNETTAEKYVLAGNLSLERGATYDVLAHYWQREGEILAKGVIR